MTDRGGERASAPSKEPETRSTMPMRVPSWTDVAGIVAICFGVATAGGVLAIGFLTLAPNSPVAIDILSVIQSGESEATHVATVLDLLVTGVGAVGSLALSAALAAIYLSQNEILDDQTEIQDRQTRIMERQRIPVLAAHEDGVHIFDGKPTPEGGTLEDLDSLETDEGAAHVGVAVENHGDETAEQIQMACLIDVPNATDPPRYPGVAPLKVDGMVTTPPADQGALLPPGEGLSLLCGVPSFSRESDTHDKRAGFRKSLKEILKEGYQVRFGFVLIFSNSLEKRYRIKLQDAYSVEPGNVSTGEDEDFELQAVLDASVTYEIDDLVHDCDWEIPEDAFVSR